MEDMSGHQGGKMSEMKTNTYRGLHAEVRGEGLFHLYFTFYKDACPKLLRSMSPPHTHTISGWRNGLCKMLQISVEVR